MRIKLLKQGNHWKSENRTNKLQTSRGTKGNKDNQTITKKTGRTGFPLPQKALRRRSLPSSAIGKNHFRGGKTKTEVVKGFTQGTPHNPLPSCSWVGDRDRWARVHMCDEVACGVPELWSQAQLHGTKENKIHAGWKAKGRYEESLTFDNLKDASRASMLLVAETDDLAKLWDLAKLAPSATGQCPGSSPPRAMALTWLWIASSSDDGDCHHE
jgi:hypothetical protein